MSTELWKDAWVLVQFSGFTSRVIGLRRSSIRSNGSEGAETSTLRRLTKPFSDIFSNNTCWIAMSTAAVSARLSGGGIFYTILKLTLKWSG